ncbi:likely protein kinase [Pseudozyma hubeiensis SY62]|uniref:Likely protein kinase n=1 Tax=Pseudozyma hubeiensis (strain SY62) TaxID=1305764 RepID=R9PAG2_PSEHS|nr:likely protein kinase [Pseudozyma hubeiensis SY62]GAC98341.1 likely protein kinase [Pseudozyma hubeiensis SY62]
MTRSSTQDYRETLDAKSKDLEDGTTVINQYSITDTIGRGAYGTVRKAVLTEQPDVAFAVKEFGKTRLRKTHRAEHLRKPARGRGMQRPGNRSDPTKGGPNPKQDEQDEAKDPLTLIRHEIAILKKLHHPNVVQLFEVLDDPTKDNLYMVFEYCPDGTVIDVKPNVNTKPLPEDVARLYFVQILMGIEYLHENEIVHRDIKPDNILLTDNRKTCKIVDFGVSEMFLKPGDDTMQKSAGSPAFMSPELCTAGHAEYHGKSDDVWSFGVTLYCMVVGHLPFNKDNFYAMYEAIKNDEPEYPDHLSDDLKDLLQKMFIKDPAKRITVPQMREHPWTLAVEDGILLSKEDNLEAMVSEITDEDLDCAICKITNIFTFARAVSRFKKGGSMHRARQETMRSSSGDSNSNDRSWFPGSTSSSNDKDGSDARDSASGSGDAATKSLASDVETIKEETPTPASQDTVMADSETGKSQDSDDKVRGLEKAAASMFESPQMHTFELPPEEPNSNGPLQRDRSGPISTLHRLEADQRSRSPPIITMDSPRSASPEMFHSPASEGDAPFGESKMDTGSSSQPSSSVNTSTRSTGDRSTDYTTDTSKPDDAIASHLSDMMLEQGKQHHSSDALSGSAGRKYESPEHSIQPDTHNEPDADDDDQDDNSQPRRAKTLQERAASLGKKESKPKPKLLPDQPTCESPRHEKIKTPPGAAEVYMQCGESPEVADEEGKKDDNPYFKDSDKSVIQGEAQEKHDSDEDMPEAAKQHQTV